jgi:hypothetical protein
MNKITLFSASAFVIVFCITCNIPSEALIQEAQAFADMNKSNSSSGIKCASHVESIVEEVTADSVDVNANAYSGIICIED